MLLHTHKVVMLSFRGVCTYSSVGTLDSKRCEFLQRRETVRYRVLGQTPDWLWVVDLEERWKQHYQQVCEFYRNYGRWPYETDEDSVVAKMGVWVARNRAEVWVEM
ncbi:MAG: hypothetical protein ACKOW9_00490, partial [Candidatus Paceibacterota bacterium]